MAGRVQMSLYGLDGSPIVAAWCLQRSYTWVFEKIVVTPESSILIGFSIINHPFWGTPIFGNTHIPPFFHGKKTQGKMGCFYFPWLYGYVN